MFRMEMLRPLTVVAQIRLSSFFEKRYISSYNVEACSLNNKPGSSSVVFQYSSIFLMEKKGTIIVVEVPLVREEKKGSS